MSAQNFKKTILSALGWSFAMKMAFQLVSWALTLIVIRVLSPDDYGMMAVAQVVTTFMMGFSNLGLGDALVQREDTSRHVLASAFGMLLVVATILTLLLSLAAYPIASWYHDLRLVPLIQVSSLGFLFNAISTLPRMSLAKQMRVRPIFLAELSAGLTGSVLVIAMAFSGYGVWSLMSGWLLTNIVRQAAFFVLAAEFYVWPRFDFAAVRPMIGYGLYSTLEYMAFSFMTSADVVIIGRLLGPVALGLYAVAINFAALPVNKIAPIVNAVAFPAFALVQGRMEEARFYVIKGLRLMSVLATPVFLGIGATAPEIVDLVFGGNWRAVKPLLAILATALVFRALLILIPNYLQGTGDAKASFWCTGVGAVVFPLAILIGCHWGVAGACYGWLVAYPAVFAAEALIAAKRGGLPFTQVIATPLRPLVAGGVMVAAVSFLRPLLPAGLPEVARLLCLAATGACVYGGVLLLVAPELLRELVALLPARFRGLRAA